MLKTQFLLLILFISSDLLLGQDLTYVKGVVDTLSSAEMHGRGYTNNGDKKAADYIKDQFIEIGLKPFSESFLQSFKLPVNTFPGEVIVNIDKKPLEVGKDFIVAANSPGLFGTFEL